MCVQPKGSTHILYTVIGQGVVFYAYPIFFEKVYSA